MADLDRPRMAMEIGRERLREEVTLDGERLVPPVGLVDGVLSFEPILIATLNVRGINQQPKYLKIINQLASMNY